MPNGAFAVIIPDTQDAQLRRGERAKLRTRRFFYSAAWQLCNFAPMSYFALGIGESNVRIFGRNPLSI